MSMPEYDDFFRRLGKKLDTELPFEQLPDEWAQVAAQIPVKRVRKKFAWWWLLFFITLAGNIVWYTAHRQLQNELRKTTEALVAAQHLLNGSQQAPAPVSGTTSISKPDAALKNNVRTTFQRTPTTALPVRFKNQVSERATTNTDGATVQNTAVQLTDLKSVTVKNSSDKILFPIPHKEPVFLTKPSLYLVKLKGETPGAITTIDQRRHNNWKVSPLLGYAVMELDSQQRTGGLQAGLNVSRRIIGDFSITAGLARRSWQFGLKNPESSLIGAKDESCLYCPSDTILVSRTQWSASLSLMYEKSVTDWLGIQLGAGWTYVPRFDQKVTFRYIPVYGGTQLITTERNIPVPAYSLAHIRAGLVFPVHAKISGLFAAQYDVPLKAGKVGWWSLQGGWQIAF